MNKYLTLLLLSTLLYSSCKKDPKVVPNVTTEPQTEQEADPVMFARKNFDGEIFLTTKCRDGNIVGLRFGGNADPTLRKISAADGSILWDKPKWQAGNGYSNHVLEMPNGDIWTTLNGNGANFTTVAAYDAMGNQTWKTELPINLEKSRMIPVNDNEILIVGLGVVGFAPSTRKIFVVKMNINGDTLSTTSHTVSNFNMTDAIRTSKGHVVIAGYDQPTGHPKLLLLDEDLDLTTEKVLSTDAKHINCMAELNNGDVVCAGDPQYPVLGDGFVMYLNSSLQLLETHVYHNDTLPIKLLAIVKTKTGYAVAGTLGHRNILGKYAFVASVDMVNNVKRQRFFPQADNTSSEYFSGIYNNGSGYLLVGTAAPGMHYKYFVATLNKELEGQWE